MFMLATIHLCATYRILIEGKGYLGSFGTWYNSLSTVTFVTQEILGSGVAIYRTWIIWNHSWKIVTIPTVLLLCEIVTGYTPCILPAIRSPSELATDHLRKATIAAFPFINVILIITCTSLMVYPLLRSHRTRSRLRTNAGGWIRKRRGTFVQIIRIMIESAVLQAIVEVLIIVFYFLQTLSSQTWSMQYIFYSITTTCVGITFTLITLRVKVVGSGILPVVKDQAPLALSAFSVNLTSLTRDGEA
ncbi:hypothetical protein L218DRAFT_1006681 [Marasmius fiardii PR-910]|nr:hypothetical protein L218DRAFT_1006681 [Marasmius fiardii PR-910]